MVYCDTNLLVRLYAEMPDSQHALAHVGSFRRGGGNPLPITWLHQAEFANALEQLVFFARSGSGSRMTAEQAAISLAQFDEDLGSGSGLAERSLDAGELVTQARGMSARHTARHGFRTYDIIHVASARLLGCDAFWSFDMKANKLASLEGLKTL